MWLVQWINKTVWQGSYLTACGWDMPYLRAPVALQGVLCRLAMWLGGAVTPCDALLAQLQPTRISKSNTNHKIIAAETRYHCTSPTHCRCLSWLLSLFCTIQAITRCFDGGRYRCVLPATVNFRLN